MSTTETLDSGSATAPAADASLAAAAASQTDATAAASDSANQSATEAPKTPQPTGAAAAYARALERRQNTPTREQAPAPGGDSTRTTSEGEQQPAPDGQDPAPSTPSTSASEAPKAAADSTDAAPTSWPKEWREQYAKLPTEARGLVKDQYAQMQGVLTRASQFVADHRPLAEQLQRSGLDPKRASAILDLGARFEQDPKAVLKELAQQKGVELFFERPAPAGEVPEFKDAGEMATWVSTQVEQRLQDALATRERDAQAERERDAQTERQRARMDALAREFQEARTLEGFDDQAEAILTRIRDQPLIGVREAYDLARLPQMNEELTRLRGEAKELAALKQKLERQAKAATAPPPGGRAAAKAVPERHRSPGQKAYARALAKRQKANGAAA